MNELTTDELLDDLDYCGYDPYYDDFRKDIVTEIRRRLEEQPEIVRCKNCKHWDTYNVECMKRHHPVPPYDNWFCADGVKRE